MKKINGFNLKNNENLQHNDENTNEKNNEQNNVMFNQKNTQMYNQENNFQMNGNNYVSSTNGNINNIENSHDSAFSADNYVDEVDFKEQEKKEEQEEAKTTKSKRIIIMIIVIITIFALIMMVVLNFKQVETNEKEKEIEQNNIEQQSKNDKKTYDVGTDVSIQVSVDTEKVYSSIDELFDKGDNTSSIVRGVSVGIGTNKEPDRLAAEDLGWKVLKDNGDTVDLISINSTNLKITLTKSSGYNNGVKALNDICNTLYGNATINGKKAIEARSVNFEDFYSDSRNFNDFSYKSNNKYPISLDNDNKDYKTGWSAQSSYYFEPQNEQSVFAKGGLNVKSNQYDGGTNQNTSLATTGKQYWLASRCIYTGVDACNFGIRRINEKGIISYWPTFSSDGKVASPSISIRPVVRVSKDSLK